MSFEEKVMNYLAEIHQKMTGIESEVAGIKKTVIRIENDHGQKLSALFDGYEQNTQAIEQLKQGQERIEHRMDKLEHRVDRLESGMDRLIQGQEELSLKVEQNTQAIKSLEDRVATQEIKLQLIK